MPGGVTDEAPATTRSLTPEERSAAFRQRTPAVPPRFLLIVVGVLAVLGIGGAVAEHVLSSTGLDGSSATTTTTSGVIAPPPAPGTPQLGAPLASFMGVTAVSPAPAPAVALVDQAGRPVSLAGLHGDVIVLTFFNASCTDICPVVSAELRAAVADLGLRAAHVALLTVDTDPLALSRPAAAAVAVRSGLGALPQWHFLTGDLGALDRVWTQYGVSVNVSQASGIVAHNDLMVFVDPAGRIRYRATPFADEGRSGTFTLGRASVERWGQGIAHYVEQLQAGS
jgi:cytochrome oxidase Cu insertion factor (SCO1/SenC/PrrC family)